MARVVGDGLKVNVARKPGEEQIIDLMALFNQNPNRIIVVAGTVGEGGAPNTRPVSLIHAKDEKTLRVALLRNSGTSANLRRDGRVSLEIIGPDNLDVGVQGVMRLVKEAMAMSDAMAIWEMQVTKAKQDSPPAPRLAPWPASVPSSAKAQAFAPAAFA